MFGPVVKPLSYKNISTIMFLNPEVAAVGMSEQDCVSKNIPHKVVKLDYTTNARAIAMRRGDYVRFETPELAQDLVVAGPGAGSKLKKADGAPEVVLEPTVDILAARQSRNDNTQILAIGTQPRRAAAADSGLPRSFHMRVLMGRFLDRNYVACLDLKRRNIHLSAIYRHMAVIHELSGLTT